MRFFIMNQIKLLLVSVSVSLLLPHIVTAQVTCQKTCTNGGIRLEGGSTNNEGRVEMCRNRCWGTIQAKNPSLVGEAVCQSFSLTFRSFTLGTQYGYNQSKPVYHCDVNEGTLNCTDGDNNNHDSDLWVTCGPESISKAVTTTSPPTTCPSTSDPSPGRTDTVEATSSDPPLGDMPNFSIFTSVAAVLTVLVVVVVAAVVILITCVVVRRKSTTLEKSPTGLIVHNPVSSLHPLVNQSNNETTPTDRTYSSQGDCYPEVVVKRDIDNYDVIEHYQQSSSTQQNGAFNKNEKSSDLKLQHYQEVESITPNGYQELDAPGVINLRQKINTQQKLPTLEASKKDDDFYDAEEHTYSVVNKKKAISLREETNTQQDQPEPVRDEASKKEDAKEHTYAAMNKKKAKKTSEDGEGEREELPY